MDAIVMLLKEEPTLTPQEVAKRLGTTRGYVYWVMRKRDMKASPLNARICRMEARIKTIEEGMLKLLTIKGIEGRKSDFGL